MSQPLTLKRRVEPHEIKWYLASAERGDPICGPAVVDQHGIRLGQLVCILEQECTKCGGIFHTTDECKAEAS